MKATQQDLFDRRRKKRNQKPPLPLEGKEQEALFEWSNFAEGRYPELALLHHVPNGGKRTPWEGQAFKRRGVKPGVPDLDLPVARGGFIGLRIELKRVGEGKRTTAEQDWWIHHLRYQGHQVLVCEGWEAAKKAIVKYLEIER